MRPAQLAMAAAAALLAAGGVKAAISASLEPPGAERTQTEAVVVSVVDGDTLRARSPGGRDLGRIRILGIVH